MTALDKITERLAAGALTDQRLALLKEILADLAAPRQSLGLERHELADQRIVAGEIVTYAGQLLRHPHARRDRLVKIAALAVLLAETIDGARPDLPSAAERQAVALARPIPGDREGLAGGRAKTEKSERAS